MRFDRSFSIFPIRSKVELSRLAEDIFVSQGSFGEIGADRKKLRAFIMEVAARYYNNPYHNYQHAVDVLYTMAWMLERPVFRKQLPAYYQVVLLVAALVHDVEHPGNDNQWEVKTQSPLATRYKNLSVIENHSLTVTNQLLDVPELNLFDGAKGHDRETLHEMLSQLILSTDFSWHRVFLDELTQGIARKSYDFREEDFMSLVGRTLIKAADIANTSKPFRQAKAWGRRVMSEFWAQGAREKKHNLPVGPLNDPDKAEFNSAQAGFIKFAAYELFELLSRLEGETGDMVRELVHNQQYYERDAQEAAAGK